MAYFPLSVDLTGKTVFLIGSGRQIEEKYRKLLPFGATLIRKQTFTQADAQSQPAMVVAQADGREEEVYALCRAYGIPVNVVDVPKLCSFYFPALSVRGSLTISVSTGGGSPAAAGYLRQQIEAQLPSRTEEILDWLSEQRAQLRERGILKAAVAQSFAQNRPLTEQELEQLSNFAEK